MKANEHISQMSNGKQLADNKQLQSLATQTSRKTSLKGVVSVVKWADC